jgi:hypothetical protein
MHKRLYAIEIELIKLSIAIFKLIHQKSSVSFVKIMPKVVDCESSYVKSQVEFGKWKFNQVENSLKF